MATDLTKEAREGYDGNANMHLATSPCWYAHALGQYLHSTGRSAPNGVHMSRGNSIKGNGMLFKISDGTPVKFERMQ